MPRQIKAGYIDANGSTTNQSLVSNGTFVSWANTTQNLTVRYANDDIAFSGMGTGTAYVANAAGSNTQVQFNGSGAFTGSAGFTFNTSTNTIFIGNTLTISTTFTANSSLVNSPAISVSGNVTPAASNTHDLGTSSLRWRTVYTNDLELSNGIGDYTIVEGEDDLFIYNNKKGKVYKFALIEVNPSEAPPKAK